MLIGIIIHHPVFARSLELAQNGRDYFKYFRISSKYYTNKQSTLLKCLYNEPFIRTLENKDVCIPTHLVMVPNGALK